LDVEELFEVKTMNPSVTVSCAQKPCDAATCRIACGLEVVDELLRNQSSVRGEEVDMLLDLRSAMRRREDAEGALTMFCQLRRAMEERHYLAFYRLRRWFEHQIEVNVRLARGGEERKTRLRMDWYCLEPIRFHCLTSVRQSGEPMLAPRVSFAFRAVEAHPAVPKLDHVHDEAALA
jgi:hypothetical protein